MRILSRLRPVVERSGGDSTGAVLWDDCLRRWTPWNHVRTGGALAAFTLFVLAAIGRA